MAISILNDAYRGASEDLISWPITWACWINFNSFVGTNEIYGTGVATSDSLYIRLAEFTDNIIIHVANSFATSPSLIINRWYHIAGVVRSNSNRQAYLDGIGGTVDTTLLSQPTATLRRGAIGQLPRLSSITKSDQIMAHLCLWNEDISEYLPELANGRSPFFIGKMPASYYPLSGENIENRANDVVSNYNLDLIIGIPLSVGQINKSPWPSQQW